ncbi:MAG: hypothetical protein GX962_08975 [Epulopiscium sp.]|nr:hypothetical protein [Candidatus Epulonipiscium sp.]
MAKQNKNEQKKTSLNTTPSNKKDQEFSQEFMDEDAKTNNTKQKNKQNQTNMNK